MLNHIDLPKELWSYIKTVDYSKMLPDDEGHHWNIFNISDFVTTEGIKWFAQHDLILRPTAFLFRMSPNYEGPIHCDVVDYAINFVLAGHGTMEWISDLEATTYISDVHGVSYERYADIKKYNISDTWTGSAGIVRVNIPHRITTSDTFRYCLSLRTVEKMSPKTFDDAVKLIYN